VVTRRVSKVLRIWSKEELAEKTQEIEVIIPVKESRDAQYNFDSGSFFTNHFWGRRPDVVAISAEMQIVYIEFKRSTYRDEGLLEVEEAKAKEQHNSIISALKATAPEWKIEQIKILVGKLQIGS